LLRECAPHGVNSRIRSRELASTAIPVVAASEPGSAQTHAVPIFLRVYLRKEV